MSTIALIPARAGSKGLPRKNLLPLAGKPLLLHSIDAARASGACDQVVVSSDGREILELARRAGASALERPPELAGDDSPTSAAIEHAVAALALDEGDVIVLLQPTSPLRRAADVAAAIEIHRRRGRPLLSVEARAHYPDKLLAIGSDGLTEELSPGAGTRPRQLMRPCVKPNGAIYVFSVAEFRAAGDVPLAGACTYPMDCLASVDIDDADDLALAERVLRQRQSEIDRQDLGP
ncbi:MAG TPA: acylneuraminate cytidylyltransferase family protein [Candidatus Polarisedimenticolaceae bacterium]|nr:acylneuraminate cytidylyltransferase family protein [Candidatus Polarisedimenticolaceae bacterium]